MFVDISLFLNWQENNCNKEIKIDKESDDRYEIDINIDIDMGISLNSDNINSTKLSEYYQYVCYRYKKEFVYL